MTETQSKRVSTYGQGRQALQERLAQRLPFTTSGALYSEVWERDYITFHDLGEMPVSERNTFMLDHMTGIVYVVWSYQTPIAWVRKDGEVIIPDVTYSRTTTKHQGIVRTHL